jgi:hypothetical protein
MPCSVASHDHDALVLLDAARGEHVGSAVGMRNPLGPGPNLTGLEGDGRRLGCAEGVALQSTTRMMSLGLSAPSLWFLRLEDILMHDRSYR